MVPSTDSYPQNGPGTSRGVLGNDVIPKTLEELKVFIRATVPQPKSIHRLQSIPEADAVRFVWSGREFVVVRSSLEALEIKNRNQLFVTGASMLMHLVLAGKTDTEKTLGSMVGDIQQAEYFITSANRDKGFTLLSVIKSSLKELLGPLRRQKVGARAA